MKLDKHKYQAQLFVFFCVPKFYVCNHFFFIVAVYIQNVGMFYVEYPLFAYTLTPTQL